MGARMSLKMQFLPSHLESFPENNGDLNDEHGKRFHLDIKLFEETLTKTFVKREDALNIFKHVFLNFAVTLNKTFGLVCLLLCLICYKCN